MPAGEQVDRLCVGIDRILATLQALQRATELSQCFTSLVGLVLHQFEGRVVLLDRSLVQAALGQGIRDALDVQVVVGVLIGELC